MTTDLKALFDIDNESAKQLAQIIKMINTSATEPMVRLHLISHFEDKLKDPKSIGCTPAIHSLLEFCFKNFEREQINFLIEAIQPDNMEMFTGTLDDMVEYIKRRHNLKPPKGFH